MQHTNQTTLHKTTWLDNYNFNACLYFYVQFILIKRPFLLSLAINLSTHTQLLVAPGHFERGWEWVLKEVSHLQFRYVSQHNVIKGKDKLDAWSPSFWLHGENMRHLCRLPGLSVFCFLKMLHCHFPNTPITWTGKLEGVYLYSIEIILLNKKYYMMDYIIYGNWEAAPIS